MNGKLLIIDDNQNDLDLMRLALEDDFDIVTSPHGEEGIELTQNHEPHLILLDILMPVMDGFEILERIKGNDNTQHIPIIMMTGAMRKEDQAKALGLGAYDFIDKNISPELLRHRLNTIFTSKQIAYEREQEAIHEIERRIFLRAKRNNIDTEPIEDLLQEINIFQSELEAQNEELRIQQQTSLELSLRLSDLDSNLPIGYIRTETNNFEIIEINQTARELLRINVNRDQELTLPTRLKMNFDVDLLELVNWLESEIDFSDINLKSKHKTQYITLSKGQDFNKNQLICITDTTKRTILEQEKLSLAKHNEKLSNEANLNKSRFLANMSHELRTPMHAIRSFTHLILKDSENLPDNTKQFLKYIDQSSDRLLELLNDLLDLSKLESGSLTTNIKKNNFTKVINQVLDELKALADDKQINIHLITQHQNSPFSFDKKLICQAIINLLGNAIKFSPNNSEITITTEDTAEPGPKVRFSILDHGIGIPSDELENIFKPFEQSIHTKSNAGGTGLGLAITREIIELHEGKIWAESPPKGQEQGSRLVFEIPRK